MKKNYRDIFFKHFAWLLLFVGVQMSAQTTINLQINASNNDAEERSSNGSMDLTSTDLELPYDASNSRFQVVGMRFTNVTIPQGATIENAYFTFTSDGSDSGNVGVRIYAQDAGSTAVFTNSAYNITTRPLTSAFVEWRISDPWSSGSSYNSIDISSLINEVVSRPDWVNGGSLVFIIEDLTTVTNKRGALSYDGSSSNAPRLSITYTNCSPEMGAPVFALGSTSTRCQGSGNVLYSASATGSTSISYSLDNASLAAGNTINTSTGRVSYVAGWSGTSVITATAQGCRGPKTATHTVTHNASVGTPVFNSYQQTRCTGAGTTTYSATAPGATGYSYSISNTGSGTQPTINSTTGQVNYPSNWVGQSTITVTASGCSNTTTASIVVNSNSVIAVADSYNAISGVELQFNVLTNDLCNLDPSTVTLISEPNNGILNQGLNGNFTYLPLGNNAQTVTFQYRVCSTGGINCSTATVTINVQPNINADPCLTASQEKIFYMPFPENPSQLLASLRSAGSNDSNSVTNVRNITALSVPYPSTIIIYDHWEDGYEPNLLNPSQPTTQIWGDGILSNGIAPGTTTDLIAPGYYLPLDNTFAWDRPTSTVVYDGKDKIYSSNEISLTKVTGSLETFGVQSVKTNVISTDKFGSSYILPFGEDVFKDATRVFRYTGLFARAVENGTTIQIKNKNGVVIATSPILNEGGVWYYGGTASAPGVATDTDNSDDLKAGYLVSSNKVFGVDLVFGGIDNYGTRNIPLYPAEFYGDTYFSPMYSTNADAPAKAYFVNPNPNPITINWTSGNGTSGSFNVSGDGGINVFTMSAPTGTKFKSAGGESFTAVVISDDDMVSASTYDAAFTLLPESRLTNFVKLGWAPGSSDGTGNYNPLWVTPTANTTVYVKYDGNITQGSASRKAPCGGYYDVSYNVTALNSLLITNPSNDNSGMAVFNCNDVPMAALWGQKPFDGTPTGAPAMDVGYTVDGLCLRKMVFAADDTVNTGIATPVTISVADNDSGFLVALTPSSVTAITQPANGTIVVNSNGTITYTPNLGFQGTDTFEYQICGSDPNGTYCDTATVYVNVNCDLLADSNIITGVTFMDLNKNQTPDDTEFPVQNVEIELYNDLNKNGVLNTTDTLAQTVTSNTNGKYTFAVTTKQTVRDEFTNNTISGNNGTQNWVGDWVAINQTNLTSSSNDVRIQSNYLHVNMSSSSNQYGARRTVNLTGKTKAILTYTWDKSAFSADSNDWVDVQVATSATGAYTTIYRFTGSTAGSGSHSFDISAYISNATTIRFVEPNNSVTSNATKYVRFDNIEIKYFNPASYIVKVKDTSVPGLQRTTPVSPNYHAITFNAPEVSDCDTNFGFSSNLVATDDINQTTVNVPVTGNLFTNDNINTANNVSITSLKIDVNGDGVFETTIVANGSAQTIPGVGTISVNPTTGKYVFVPASNYVGEVPTIQYTIRDQYGVTDIATLQIVVVGEDSSNNYPPIAQNDHSVMTPGTPVTINILANDNDVDGTITRNSVDLLSTGIAGATCINTNTDGDCISVRVVGQGTWSVNQTTGAVTFTPVSGFVGVPTPIQYTVRDNDFNVSNPATISIELANASVNEFYANDDANSGFAGSTMTGNILTNDVNPENIGTPSTTGISVYNASGSLVPATIGVATPVYAINPSNPSNYILAGVLTVNANGTYTYVSNAEYVGTANVVYTACDNASLGNVCDTATLYLMTAPKPISTCTNPGDFTESGKPTKVGITVQSKQESWPESVPNGFIALESKEKGMVITRVQKVGGGLDGAPNLTDDSIKDPIEGMLVYDITARCVKLFNGKIWKCIQGCN